MLPLLAAGAGASAGESEPAVELAQLERERAGLEREIARYKASISLLLSNGADFDSPSMRALGRSQYIGKASLPRGALRLTVRSRSRSVELTGDAASDDLVTLHAPREGDSELHQIPVDELRATRWSDIPTWEPDPGAASSTTS